MNKWKYLGFAGLMLPVVALAALSSGPQLGQDVYAFQPDHVTGPDAGTHTCPVCKYGKEPAMQVWVNNASDAQVGKIAETLESRIDHFGLHSFRAFVIFIEPTSKTDAQVSSQLVGIATKYKLHNVALAYVRPGDESISHYKINTASGMHDTIFAYANMKVVKSVVNLKATHDGLKDLVAAADLAVSKG